VLSASLHITLVADPPARKVSGKRSLPRGICGPSSVKGVGKRCCAAQQEAGNAGLPHGLDHRALGEWTLGGDECARAVAGEQELGL